MCSAKAAFFVVESHLNTAYPQMDPLDRRRLALQWVDAAPLVTYSCECCVQCRALAEHAKYRAACTLCGVDPARSHGQFTWLTAAQLAIARGAALRS